MHKSIELGYNFYDATDMYGSETNEQLLGKAFKEHWNDVLLATKFAIMLGHNGEFTGLNGKPEYVRQASDQSL